MSESNRTFRDQTPDSASVNPGPSRTALAVGFTAVLLFSGSVATGMIEDVTARAPTSPQGFALGFAAGAVLAAVLLIGGLAWLIVYLAFLKGKRPGRGLKYFSILAVAAVIGCAPLMYRAALMEDVSADRRKLLALTAEDTRAADQIINDYDRAAAAEGTSGVIRAFDLAPENLAVTRRKFERLAVLAEAAQAREVDRRRAFRTRISAADVHEAAKTRYLQEFDAEERDGSSSWVRFWILERERLALSLEMVDLMRSLLGRYEVSGKEVRFGSEADSARFGVFKIAIDEKAAEIARVTGPN